MRALDVKDASQSGIERSSWLWASKEKDERLRKSHEINMWGYVWARFYLVMHTMSETARLVKHIAAKHLRAGIWRMVYLVVIKRANNGITPVWQNIFWSFAFWHIGIKIFATHAWHCTEFSSDAKPVNAQFWENYQIFLILPKHNGRRKLPTKWTRVAAFVLIISLGANGCS